MAIKLGDMVEDRVTGFKGIATARVVYLNGCNRITVTPKMTETGKLSDAFTFDEPQLNVLEVDAVTPFQDPAKKKTATGGPPERVTGTDR